MSIEELSKRYHKDHLLKESYMLNFCIQAGGSGGISGQTAEPSHLHDSSGAVKCKSNVGRRHKPQLCSYDRSDRNSLQQQRSN